jgi:hypothetical protein
MSAIASHPDFAHCRTLPQLAPRATGKRAGILRRLYEAVMQSRQRHAERDVARLLSSSGGRLTDDIERRMTEQLIRGGYYWR